MSTTTDANAAIETYKEAAELNLDDPVRKGSQLVLPNYGQVVVTGDMHGHRKNFEKLKRFCGLTSSPSRLVILQELIHEESQGPDHPDMSHELLLEAARWKCEFPDQVFFVQSNHEVAQLTGRGIIKSGHGVLEDFTAGLEATYGPDDAPGVMEAIATFILSYPLAARTPYGVFISHTLPDGREIEDFDPSVLNRAVTREDVDVGQGAKFLWGRRHTPELVDRLAEMLDAEVFITGHQPEPEGYRQACERMLILSSDHNHGVFLPIDLSKTLTMSDLIRDIRKFVSVE